MLIEIILIIFVLSGLIGMAHDLLTPLPELTPLDYGWQCPDCHSTNSDTLEEDVFVCVYCKKEFNWKEISFSSAGVGIQ